MTRLLVLGGGLAGLAAATTAAEAGAEVLLVEGAPFLGGRRGALLAEDAGPPPANVDAAALPSLAVVRAAARIEVLTLAQAETLEATDEGFRTRIVQRPRFVTDACTRCGHCLAACPEQAPNELDAGLTARRAIDGGFAGSVPHAFFVDLASCLNDPPNYLPCSRCGDVCDDDAIDFTRAGTRTRTETVDGVILAQGFDDRRAAAEAELGEFGYGRCADVVTTVELQRLLEAPGPSGGFAVRVSDEEYAASVLVVLPQAAPFPITVLGWQLRALAAQEVAVERILLLEPPGTGAVPEALRSLVAETAVELTFASWLDAEASADGGVEARWVDLATGRTAGIRVDLLVLATDRVPAPVPGALAPETDAEGWIRADDDGRTSVPGLRAVGGAAGRQALADALAQARRAAADLCRELAVVPPAPPTGWQGLPRDERQALLEAMLHGLLARAGR